MKKEIKKIFGKMQNKNYFMKNLSQKIMDTYFYLRYKKTCRENPVDEKVVFFESFIGKQYACSPKAIYQYMLTDPRFEDYTFVWAFRKGKLKALREELEFTDPRTVLVTFKSRDYYMYCARAKYWVSNWRMPSYMKKKKEQIYIETWHGTPLKRIGIDSTIESNALASQKKSHKMYLNDAKGYNYFVSPSAFCTRVFTTAFGLDQLHKEDILIETGYPRNDALFHNGPAEIAEMKESLGIPGDKKVILYAPTWRDNQHTLGVGNTLDVESHFFRFLDQISDDYVVILRLHYLIASQVDISSYEGKVFNYSDLDDVNPLYLISDILITDYSSVFFDYANLHRPILFYMYDLEDYQKNVRDFYIDLKELPGPIVKTQEELLDAVYHVDELEKEYAQIYQKFCDTYNYLDDGEAAKRVVDLCMIENQEK